MNHKISLLTLFASICFTPFLTYAQKRPLPPDVSYVAKVHILDQAKEIAVNRTELFSSETSVCNDYPCAMQLFSFMYGLNEGLVLKHVDLKPLSVDNEYLDVIRNSFISIQKMK